VVELGNRPRSLSGHSILMISAPNAPSQRVAHGPARTQLKSTTRMFANARSCGMVSFSYQARLVSGWSVQVNTASFRCLKSPTRCIVMTCPVPLQQKRTLRQRQAICRLIRHPAFPWHTLDPSPVASRPQINQDGFSNYRGFHFLGHTATIMSALQAA
jgi:hypothetical protein